ncbi:MAG TPA: M20/M25/M40 family metallo-hydrolase [Bacteroidetes bacterium]|nr:M20/M25/M40 family metallo-hydrolase [Bacteroidota bacterium]HIL58749.1 M20/M25/M40 family metallo-hydrolase [Rhodothermales bacterium]
MIDVLQLHHDLVAIPSISRNEGPAADFVEAFARTHGEPHGVSVGRSEHNVWASLGSGDDVLLLASHLDVVPPSDGHPFDPFTPTVREGNVYGRGAVDAKASGSAMLAALLDLAASDWRPESGRLVVALTACEEVGSDENGLDYLRREVPAFPTPSAALVGEPTDLRPCLAQKGLLVLRCTARGQTAHAARAHLGANALTAMAHDLLRVDALALGPEDPFLGAPTVNATVAEGGSARNVIPDSATFWLDVRTTPARTNRQWAEVVAAELESEVHVHSARLVPCGTDPDARIARAAAAALADLGAEAEPFGSPTASDWVFLADVPAVKIGPGDSRLSHTADEHVPQAEIVRAVEVYRAIAEQYFDSPSLSS